jgi:aerobic carbon-monoxide dehydrogenase large subunit
MDLADKTAAARAEIEPLDAELQTSIPFPLSNDRWAIRFNPNGTVTIVLGVRDYGRGWFSPYFANLAAARLGIPVQQFRIYYSANHPAVLQTPAIPSASAFLRGELSPFASAIAGVIEALCEQVIERGRAAFAAAAQIASDNVGFDNVRGRYFVLDMRSSHTLIEIAIARKAQLDAAPVSPSNYEFPDPAGPFSGHCNE